MYAHLPFLYSNGQSSKRMRGFTMWRRIFGCVTSLLNITPSSTWVDGHNKIQEWVCWRASSWETEWTWQTSECDKIVQGNKHQRYNEGGMKEGQRIGFRSWKRKRKTSPRCIHTLKKGKKAHLAFGQFAAGNLFDLHVALHIDLYYIRGFENRSKSAWEAEILGQKRTYQKTKKKEETPWKETYFHFFSVSSALDSITLSLRHCFRGKGIGIGNWGSKKRKKCTRFSYQREVESFLFLWLYLSPSLTHTPAANSGFEERTNHRATG